MTFFRLPAPPAHPVVTDDGWTSRAQNDGRWTRWGRSLSWGEFLSEGACSRFHGGTGARFELPSEPDYSVYDLDGVKWSPTVRGWSDGRFIKKWWKLLEDGVVSSEPVAV